jgi:hypothetical protein
LQRHRHLLRTGWGVAPPAPSRPALPWLRRRAGAAWSRGLGRRHAIR